MGELLSAPEHGVTRVEWDKFISSLPQVVEDRPGLYQLIYFTASRCTPAQQESDKGSCSFALPRRLTKYEHSCSQIPQSKSDSYDTKR